MSEEERAGQPQRYCRNCGAEIRRDTTFCTSCGERVRTGAEGIGGDPANSRAAQTDGGPWFFTERSGAGGPVSGPFGCYVEVLERLRRYMGGLHPLLRNEAIFMVSMAVSAVAVVATVLTVVVFVLVRIGPMEVIVFLFVLGVLALTVWAVVRDFRAAREADDEARKAHGPPLRSLVFAPSPSQCLDRAEGFMAREGFKVARGGGSVSFFNDKRFNVGLFLVLLIAGLVPGILYAILVALSRSPGVTLVAAPADGGTELDIVGEDKEGRALLENWIKGPRGIPTTKPV